MEKGRAHQRTAFLRPKTSTFPNAGSIGPRGATGARSCGAREMAASSGRRSKRWTIEQRERWCGTSAEEQLFTFADCRGSPWALRVGAPGGRVLLNGSRPDGRKPCVLKAVNHLLLETIAVHFFGPDTFSGCTTTVTMPGRPVHSVRPAGTCSDTVSHQGRLPPVRDRKCPANLTWIVNAHFAALP